MSARNDGGQAFPSEFFETEHGDRVEAFAGSAGMTLRDYFAAHAPWARANFLGEPEDGAVERVAAHMAKKAYAFADAMLAERSK
jgi:hypothetical protein